MRCYIGKHFFDYEDGDFAHSISDNMAIDMDSLYPVGLMMKMIKITAAERC